MLAQVFCSNSPHIGSALMSVAVTIESGSLRITVESGPAQAKQPNGGPNGDRKENEQQPKPNGEDTDTDKEFEHVEVDEVTVYDTNFGSKIHYSRHCRGLRTAASLHQLFVCTCWNHGSRPKPDQEVALYTVGLRKFACCSKAKCVPEEAVMATPKLVCKLCGAVGKSN